MDFNLALLPVITEEMPDAIALDIDAAIQWFRERLPHAFYHEIERLAWSRNARAIVRKTGAKRYKIFSGSPSWHQRKAGHGFAGCLIGYYTPEALEMCLSNLRKQESNVWAQEYPEA